MRFPAVTADFRGQPVSLPGRWMIDFRSCKLLWKLPEEYGLLCESNPARSDGIQFHLQRSSIMAEDTRRRPLKKLAKRIQTARVNILERRIDRLSKRKTRVQKRAEK
jgi:hypothetical protein